MHPQEAADFDALGFVTFAPRKPFQARRRAILGLGGSAARNFRSEMFEELKEGFDVAIHGLNYVDA